ncbi:hypothetical protein JRO89_XS05G0020600 [Xanthoceras sorbifolium]|uniref:Pentatricopeptide repeat-containing protein n=1 Tax=Xanthoceras sorbifolium TaxID=99658 RepID=A0ABQ8HZZ2_9ROSI|nr:hypothetical protein JRO89_XS05G0020600 [Xanthoceras sorbifolium]
MKFLQDLVPGCSKAVMLDEIINYVQSLQRQVEVWDLDTSISSDIQLHNVVQMSYGTKLYTAYAGVWWDHKPLELLFYWLPFINIFTSWTANVEDKPLKKTTPSPDPIILAAMVSIRAASRLIQLDSFLLLLTVCIVKDFYMHDMEFTGGLSEMKVCTKQHQAKQIHCLLIKTFTNPETFLLNNLINSYGKLGNINYARRLFDKMPQPNIFSWNTILSAYSKSGHLSEMQYIFNRMPDHGFESLNRITFSTMLILSSSKGRVDLGRQIHGQIVKFGFGSYVFVGSPLVDMYAKIGLIYDAKRVFDGMLERNVVMYNTIITGLLRCGLVEESERLFHYMKEKDSISWTTMITGLTQNGLERKAIDFFRGMRLEGLAMDQYTFGNDFTLGSVISSCANLASLEEGAQFHGHALVSGLISFITVSNALITLYGKCGSIEDSHQLFNGMNIRDEVSWTALVSGYAQFGKANETIELFERMLAHGMNPDGVTFIGVLSACSRAGLVEKGRRYFESMVEEHGITPIHDHYTCMIDLLSRAGRLDEAKTFINKMPFCPDAIGWATLLSSCRTHGNVEIGKWAAESLLELEPQNPASYILLSSIYALKGKWDLVSQLRKRMRDKGVRKEPGCSWIKYNNKVHIFSADDQSSPYSDKIYAELEKLNLKMIEEGYVPDVSSVLHNVEDSEKMEHVHVEISGDGVILVP